MKQDVQGYTSALDLDADDPNNYLFLYKTRPEGLRLGGRTARGHRLPLHL